MERKTGEIFKHGDEWYQCVESTGCALCAFNETDCNDIDTGSCEVSSRSDGKSVVFKSLKKIGDPFYRRWTLEGNNKLMQRYKTYTTPLIMTDKQEVFYNLTDDLLEIEIKQNKMEEVNNPNLSNTEKIGKNLKPFDLQAAKSGKPVCIRDGRKARIICFDAKDKDYPIVALVEMNGVEEVARYTNKGKWHIDSDRDLDLVMTSVKHEGWINIHCDIDLPFYSGIFKTKEEAERFYLQNKDIDKTEVRTIKVEWEE